MSKMNTVHHRTMKIAIVLGAILATFGIAVGADPDPRLPPYRIDPSEEDILKDLQIFKQKLLPGLSIVVGDVARGLVRTAAHILTDNLRLRLDDQVYPAFDNGVSPESIIPSIGDLILKRSTHNIIFRYPSHEGIVNEVGPFHGMLDAEENLSFRYNSLIPSDGPSHEQVGGNLGSLVLQGFSDLAGVPVPGDVLGYPYYGPPPRDGVSPEEINNGILKSTGELLLKGAVKSANSLIRSLYKPFDYLHKHNSLLLARGQYKDYPNLEIAAQEVLFPIRRLINQKNFSHAKECIKLADLNLTKLLDQYVQNSQQCHNSSYPQGQVIIKLVYDILLEAFHQVENLQREATNCFERLIPENRRRCLEQEVPSLLASVTEKVREYSGNLRGYVLQFSNLNTEFDVCLTKQVGFVRKVVYNIENGFRSCVEQQQRL